MRSVLCLVLSVLVAEAMATPLKTLGHLGASYGPWPHLHAGQQNKDGRPGEDGPKVEVGDLGTFVGTTMPSLNDRTINCFRGIKFGIADRFQYSTPAGKWSGKDETVTNEDGEKCLQKSSFGNFASGSEDCLFLNVYVPADSKTENMTVMVFVHGGSFTGGDASMYLPTRLLDTKDVILVVIQYRLGALGFLSTLTNDIPGNAGLSDQILALQWVQDYIGYFGGDKSQVMLFGQSAGSVSVSILTAIGDKTNGLFKSVISESGSALEYWAIDEHPEESAINLAVLCGSHSTDINAVTAYFLNDISAEDLTMCSHESVSQQHQNGQIGFDGVSPVVQIGVSDPIIRMPPADYMEQGLGNDVPFMSGCVRDEGSYVFALMTEEYLKPKGLLNDTDYFEYQAIPDVLAAIGIDDTTRSFSKVLKEKYFAGVENATYDNVAPGMVDMLGMLFLKSGTYDFAQMHSRYYDSDTYFYSFDFVSENSLFDFMYLTEDPPFDGGVTHADELMYLFALPSALTDDQRLTSERLVELWTNFAIYGNPTPTTKASSALDDLGIPEWNPLTPDSSDYLLIEDTINLKVNYPDRWTYENEVAQTGTAAPGDDATTTSGPGGSTTTSGPGGPGNSGPSQDEYDDLKKKSDAFMASMIVFIVLFVVSSGGAVFFYLKTR